MESSIRYYRTGIQTLDRLLLAHEKQDGRNDWHHGLVFGEDTGFFGTVFGSAGSGKSILAMQMASLCAIADTDHLPLTGVWPCDHSDKRENNYEYSSIFLTQEALAPLTEKILSFGWIKQTDQKIFTPKDSGFLNLASGLHLAQFNLKREAQVDILRNIFEAAARDQANRTKGKKRFTLICFDNAETVVNSAFSDLLGSAPDDKNFYKATREFCRLNKLHLMMFFEEAGASSTELPQRSASHTDRYPPQTIVEVATTAQAYAADLVIRMGSHQFDNGYKERSLEIVKAKNQYHRRGRHHFSIVSGDKASSPKSQMRNADARRHPGIEIYESLATQLYNLRESQLPQGKTLEQQTSLGIKSLDLRISGRRDPETRTVPRMYMTPGTVSVLVSDLDVRAQEIALHFAFQPQSTSGQVSMESYWEAAYLSFLNPWKTIQPVLARFMSLNGTNAPPGFHHFEPEHISEGKLLKDIRTHLTDCIKEKTKDKDNDKALRVVIDNLYAIEAKYPLIQNSTHFITALFALLRSLGVVALVIDSVDVGVGTNPLDRSFAAGLGQNVFLLRHVELHSREHTAFSVVQLLEPNQTSGNISSKGMRWDIDTLWEIQHTPGNPDTLEALDTFKYYKHVISGEPTAVTVHMSVHADAKGSPLDQYMESKKKALRSSLGYTLDIESYRPDTYAMVHGAFSVPRRNPLSDCHVISIDETWLEELLRGGELEPLGEQGRYVGAVTTCHDMALNYLSDQGIVQEGQTYAVPFRNNCGVLMASTDKRDDLSGVKSWKDLLSKKSEFYNIGKHSDDVYFTFCRDQAESCVSFLIELALSFVPKGNMLVSPKRTLDLGSDVWKEALKMFVRLIGRADREEVAAGEFRPTVSEPPSVVSRQWYNTCFVPRKDKLPPQNVLQLPAGERDFPCVVSGAWYFGILRGSAAKEAGIDAIQQFTSPSLDSPGEDLRQTNGHIGLPVRYELYKDAIDVVADLPYTDRFWSIGVLDADKNKVEADHLVRSKARIAGVVSESMTEFPFYRMHIKGYRHVMPIIWGMMVMAAKHATDSGSGGYSLSDKSCQDICSLAKKRYEVVDAAVNK